MSEEIKIILDKKKVIEQIRNKIPKFYMVEVVYIFGSFVNSENFNDIDVALLISKELNPYERFKFAMKVARELERAMKPRIEFDVKILNYSPIEFQYEVLKTGKAVFVRDKVKKEEYEAATISKYLDFRVVAEQLDRKFLARV